MKKIVQLTDTEYQELYDKATLNDEQITAKAHELYEKKGIHSFEVEMRHVSREKYGSSSYISDTVTVSSDDWKDKEGEHYHLEGDTAEKFATFLKTQVSDYMRKTYGRQIDDVNYCHQLRKREEEWQRLYAWLIIIGWLAAIILAVLYIAK